LQKNYLAFKNKGVLFLGVFVMSEEKEIKEFAAAYHLTFPVGKENGIAARLKAKGMPETVFIGRDGRIAKRHSGSINDEDLQSGIMELLN